MRLVIMMIATARHWPGVQAAPPLEYDCTRYRHSYDPPRPLIRCSSTLLGHGHRQLTLAFHALLERLRNSVYLDRLQRASPLVCRITGEYRLYLYTGVT